MATKPAKTPWPHGQPTRTCSDCNGSGMSKQRAADHAMNRGPSNTQTLAAMKCGYCYGRGKVIDAPPKAES